ncbi:MAG: NAD(P)/FAD-dependent oxidoreductase [Bacteroidota bacterium]
MIKNETTSVLIIGAGLSGLCTAYFLDQMGINYQIIEARERIGGRILTVMNSKGGTLEMGATWFGDKHTHLISLLKTLNVAYEQQYIGNRVLYEFESPHRVVQLIDHPSAMELSYRLSDGTSSLMSAIHDRLNQKQISLGEQVVSLQFLDDRVKIITNNRELQVSTIICTLPPNLFINQISTTPELPKDVSSLFSQTHTWMGESIKVGLEYERAFWKDEQIGSIFSQISPVYEMHDHSGSHSKYIGLKGFMHPSFSNLSKAKRKALVIEQMEYYFGELALNPLSYHEMDWKGETHTFYPYSSDIVPHQNNGNKKLRLPYFDAKLFFAGSETSASFPGYMEGAIESALRVSDELAKSLQLTGARSSILKR